MTETGNSEALFRFTIPVFIRTLKNLEKMLSKTEQHAARHKIEFEALLSARLFPDMYNLLQQLQYACFIPVDFAKHFAGEPPRVGYDETNLDELKASITQTIEYLQGMSAKQFEGREKATLPLFFDESKGLAAEAYADRLTLPNFFFHVSMAYAILRHNGVPLGKADFLGTLGAVPMSTG